jgi:hypothetical protein
MGSRALFKRADILEIRLCVRVWARQVFEDSADSDSVQAEDPVRESGVGPGPFKLLALAAPAKTDLANEHWERIPDNFTGAAPAFRAE